MVFEFDRYINGELKAEGVTIERQKNLPGAMREAARIASRGSNGEAPVLVLRSDYASLQEQVEKLNDALSETHDKFMGTAIELAKVREGAEPFAFLSKEKVPHFDVNGTEIASVLLFPKGTLRPENECPLYLHEQTDARSGVRVRELEWHFDLKRKCYEADTLIAKVYRVKELAGSDSPYFETSGGGSWTLLYEGDDLPSAKAAAQADYEQRILSALSPAAPEGREASAIDRVTAVLDSYEARFSAPHTIAEREKGILDTCANIRMAIADTHDPAALAQEGK